MQIQKHICIFSIAKFDCLDFGQQLFFILLAIIENLLEYRPEMSSDAAQQGLLQWLLRRIKVTPPLCVISALHVFALSVDHIYFHIDAP